MKLIWISIERMPSPADPIVKCGKCKTVVPLPMGAPLGKPTAILGEFLQLHGYCRAELTTGKKIVFDQIN